VLVVDNHPVILKFMSQILKKNGCDVVTATDGLEALEVLKDYTPDVAFVDLVMPNIDGRKLCEILRGTPQFKSLYLVVLSAIAKDEMEAVSGVGADKYITKGPFPEMAREVLAVLGKASPSVEGIRDHDGADGDGIHLREVTKELLSVKRHLEVIMMSMSEGIIELNPDAKVIYANPKALSLLEIPEETLLGSTVLELFHENDQSRVDEMLKRASLTPNSDEKRHVFELNGRDVTLNVSPVRDEQDKTIIVMNDVTQQKRMEAQLQQAEKMEAIGTLAGGIAHDFNNLLMAVQGTVSLLLFNMDEGHPFYEKISSIEQWVESGARLTSQLLGYARKGKYEVKAIDLNRMVRDTSETFGRTRKDIVILTSLDPEVHSAKADKGQIEQVLFNLYVNAANAMPDGGTLSLRTHNVSDSKIPARLYEPRPGQYVELTVTDTGKGMDAKTMERIFEPFYTTQEMSRGTGLGLASVYGIVKGHEGYIEVESEKGVGTTFKVYLPASTNAVVIESPRPSRREIRSCHETILLVDDEQMILDVGQELLQMMGYTVLTAENGKKAVEVYDHNKDNIDLLILDMVMPGMKGGEVFDEVKAINPNAKVLLSSGYSVDGEATEILHRGCNGFIQKPFHIEELSENIRQVLTRQAAG
jgi:PAS domain S-box-containing protein